jgi:hypothetical protein
MRRAGAHAQVPMPFHLGAMRLAELRGFEIE